MIYTLTVPGTIEDTKELRVLEWHRAASTRVGPGDLLVELETHKVLIEVRAGQAGFLRQIICADGGWCAIGGPLALLSDTLEEALDGPPQDLPMLMADFEIC